MGWLCGNTSQRLTLQFLFQSNSNEIHNITACLVLGIPFFFLHLTVLILLVAAYYFLASENLCSFVVLDILLPLLLEK